MAWTEAGIKKYDALSDQINNPRAQQQPNWWDQAISALGKPGLVDENSQDVLAGMAQAINPQGMTGQMGGAFQQYLRSIAAQKAHEAQMKQRQDFLGMITKMLSQPTGQDPYKPNPGYSGAAATVPKLFDEKRFSL